MKQVSLQRGRGKPLIFVVKWFFPFDIFLYSLKSIRIIWKTRLMQILTISICATILAIKSIYWIKNSDLIIDTLVYTNVQIFIYCANQCPRVKAKSWKDKTIARPIYDRRLLNSVARLGPIGRTRPANLFPIKQSHSLKLERCISFRDPSETQSYIHTYIQ